MKKFSFIFFLFFSFSIFAAGSMERTEPDDLKETLNWLSEEGDPSGDPEGQKIKKILRDLLDLSLRADTKEKDSLIAQCKLFLRPLLIKRRTAIPRVKAFFKHLGLVFDISLEEESSSNSKGHRLYRTVFETEAELQEKGHLPSGSFLMRGSKGKGKRTTINFDE